MNETSIEGRFKKLLGISTFGNGDSKKDTDTTLKMIKKNWTLHNAMGAFSQKMTIMTWYFFVLNSFERFFKKIRKKKSIHQMIWTLQKFTIYVLTKSLCTYVISYRT